MFVVAAVLFGVRAMDSDSAAPSRAVLVAIAAVCPAPALITAVDVLRGAGPDHGSDVLVVGRRLRRNKGR